MARRPPRFKPRGPANRCAWRRPGGRGRRPDRCAALTVAAAAEEERGARGPVALLGGGTARTARCGRQPGKGSAAPGAERRGADTPPPPPPARGQRSGQSPPPPLCAGVRAAGRPGGPGPAPPLGGCCRAPRARAAPLGPRGLPSLVGGRRGAAWRGAAPPLPSPPFPRGGGPAPGPGWRCGRGRPAGPGGRASAASGVWAPSCQQRAAGARGRPRALGVQALSLSAVSGEKHGSEAAAGWFLAVRSLC